MQTEKGRKTVAQRKTGAKTKTRILKLVLVLAVVLIVLVFLLLPALVSSEKGRRIILARINNYIDGQTDFATLSMSWFKGLKVTDVSFTDKVGQTSVKVKQIATRPHYGSILTGSLSFGETIIDEPKVEINLKDRQTSKTKAPQQAIPPVEKPQAIGLPIKKIDLVINNGNLKVTDSKAESVEVTGINSRLTIDFPARYPAGQTDKTLENLNTKAKVGFASADYMGLNFGQTELDVQVQNGVLKIAPFSTTVNNGRINFAGQADFKQKPTLLRTPEPMHIIKDIQINDQTTKKLLMYINPIFANAFNVAGVANFNCERLAIPLAAATKNDAEVVGTVSITKLRLQASDLLGQILSLVGTNVRGQDITIRPTRFVLRNGLLRYDDMQIDIGDSPVNFKGVIGLDKTLNMTVTLPYTMQGRLARVGEETAGQRISLPLKGSLDKPELDMDKLLEQQLKKRLEQQLRKSLEGLFR